MRVKIILFVCLLMLWFRSAAYVIQSSAPEPQTVAWWSLTYERPNPERLPVEVRWRWMP